MKAIWTIPLACVLLSKNGVETTSTSHAAAAAAQLGSVGSEAVSTNVIQFTSQLNPQDGADPVRSFEARGVIESLPASGEAVVVRHEEIRGLMPKMTMEFSVRDTNELRNLRPGDAITFHVRTNDKESWIDSVQRAASNDSPVAAPPNPVSTSLLRVAKLKQGDLFPDADLVDENGNALRVSSFEGRAVALTFLFTRCPLPDFCPRMNLNFNQARELLLEKHGVSSNWQFLSISFDPDFDKPEVLRRYAASYRGPRADRWLFAAAPAKALTAWADPLDFRFAKDGGSFVHNLRTLVLDPHRRIYRQFDGNKWKPEELAAALAEAAQAGDAKDHPAR